MAHLISAVVVIICICLINSIAGYKWVSVKPGSPIPKDAVRLNNKLFVGRAAHYNLILPAVVYNSSYAVVYNTVRNEEIPMTKKVFEILVAKEKCEWKSYRNFSEVPEKVVRLGRAWNREPIYLGAVHYSSNDNGVKTTSILMTSKKNLPRYSNFALVCVDNTTWVDVAPPKIQVNAIPVGLNEGLVARLVGPWSFVPGIIRSGSNVCSASYNGTEINSSTCQALVGTSKEYSWQAPGKFERIPENAVLVGRTENDEFIYVSKDDFGRLDYAIFSELVNTKLRYEILVKNNVDNFTNL